MSSYCQNCGDGFAYDPGSDSLDIPPEEGMGHVAVVVNPVDEFADQKTTYFCDVDCLVEYQDDE